MVQKNGDWYSLGHWINFIMYYYKKLCLYKAYIKHLTEQLNWTDALSLYKDVGI